MACRRQGRIQRVYNGMLKGRGGSGGFTMICWKAGADPEGLQWYAGRQGGSRGFTMVCRRQGWIRRVHHDMLEGRGGYRGFTMVC